LASVVKRERHYFEAMYEEFVQLEPFGRKVIIELLRCKMRLVAMFCVPEDIKLSKLMSLLRGLILSIQSRSPRSLISPEHPFGTVESASIEMPTIEAKSSRSF